MDTQELKKLAANRAVEFVESGMVVGLGTGSTAIWAVRRLAEKLKSSELANIVGVPTSLVTAQEAQALGIPLATLDEQPHIDITIDGADEVDPNLDVIKGGGGALLREKLVAQASQRMIVIVDESKLSPALGTKFYVPVEVVTFGWTMQQEFLASIATQVDLRQKEGKPFVTDHGNYILDCRFGAIQDPAQLAERLKQRTGIVDSGLFIGLVTDVIVARADGIEYKQR
ncbi:MAG: ribose-5-phosphate isomerase RpiA [Caldilineaceae bacterium]